jgi:alanyl-tRNA synthetase
MLPSTDTVVLYPSGSVHTEARVLHVASLGERDAVVLDATSAHPVDAGWPDQGPDLGVLTVGGVDHPLLDVVVAATDGADLHVGDDVAVRPGAEGWAFLVAHIIAPGSGVTEGAAASVAIDADHRRALSVGHTACHLASLALNRAMAQRWTKEVRADALGSPDFDNAAIESSRILENGSIDVFRINKSLRRKGFVADGLAEALPAIEAAANEAITDWVSTDAAVRIDRDGERLTDRRRWVCDLPEASASIPCGGTHVDSSGELGTVRIALELGDADGTPTLTMRTSALV